MNSLEWIDKQILLVKENIQYHKDLLAESEEEYTDEIISVIKLLEPKLQTLQQIKDILEAWEVCINDNAILDVLKTLAKGESINWHRLPEEKQKILKKVLEVKENDNSKNKTC